MSNQRQREAIFYNSSTAIQKAGDNIRAAAYSSSIARCPWPVSLLSGDEHHWSYSGLYDFPGQRKRDREYRTINAILQLRYNNVVIQQLFNYNILGGIDSTTTHKN
jgi:hypothetical protein